MRLFSALITMLVILALAGGAQACAAICGAGAKTQAVPVKVHGCCKGGEKSKSPVGEKPCGKCEKAGQVGVHVQKAVSIDAPELVGVIDAVIDFDVTTVKGGANWDSWHGPPLGRLHVFCVLLI